MKVLSIIALFLWSLIVNPPIDEREFDYTITGFSDRISDGQTVYLVRSDLIAFGNDLLDSTISHNGRFILSGKTSERSFVVLKSDTELITRNYFILDSSPISVHQQDGITKIIGGGDQQLMDSIKGIFDIADRVRRSISDSMDYYTSINQPILAEYFKGLYGKIYFENVGFHDRVFYSDPKNFNSFYALQYAIGAMSDKNFEDNHDFYSRLSPELKRTRYGRTIASYIYRDTLSRFTDIAGQVDTSGTPLKYNFPAKGYTLIDFWASWCGPCRANVPVLKELYEKYNRSSAFEIIGITIDDSERAWKQAVFQDEAPWINVAEYVDNSFLFPGLELRARANRIAVYSGSLYVVPQYFLLDPQGRIVLKSQDIEEVIDMVEKVHAFIYQKQSLWYK